MHVMMITANYHVPHDWHTIVHYELWPVFELGLPTYSGGIN